MDTIRTDENGTPSSLAIGGHNVKLLGDIQLMGGSQLRNLRVATAAKNLAHFAEHSHKGQIFVGVEDWVKERIWSVGRVEFRAWQFE